MKKKNFQKQFKFVFIHLCKNQYFSHVPNFYVLYVRLIFIIDSKLRVLKIFYNFFFHFTFFLTIYQKKTFQLHNTALFSLIKSIFRCFLLFWPPSHKTKIFLALDLISAWKMLYAYFFSRWNSKDWRKYFFMLFLNFL